MLKQPGAVSARELSFSELEALHFLPSERRQKIEPRPDSPKILVTELGVGYRLAQSETADEAERLEPAQAGAESGP